MALKPLHNEEELLKEIAAGNEKAFSQLFYWYHNQLGEFVFSLSHCMQISEEIVQDVFMKIWADKEALLSISSFKSYIFILTRNYTLNALRKLANEKKKGASYEEYLEGNTATEASEYDLLIENAVLQLPPQQQKVFLLKQQGLKNVEVAIQMEISPNSVKKYQQWALLSISKFVKAKAALTYLISLNLFHFIIL